MCVGIAATAFAQESKDAGKDAHLLLRMGSPSPMVTSESVTRDDLRGLPPPQMDRLAESTRFHVVVGDKCLPGEDLGRPIGRSSRSTRSR